MTILWHGKSSTILVISTFTDDIDVDAVAHALSSGIACAYVLTHGSCDVSSNYMCIRYSMHERVRLFSIYVHIILHVLSATRTI